MIRLLENEGTRDIKLYDVVNYAGHDWYVIYIDDEDVHLLAKDKVFGRHIFDEKSNDYKASDIREYLNSEILPKLKSRGANPLPIYMSDIGVADRVWLLSVKEAERIPENIRKFGDYWWLRSPSSRYNDCAVCVVLDGSVYDYGGYVNDDILIVRPAMRVKLEDLQ